MASVAATFRITRAIFSMSGMLADQDGHLLGDAPLACSFTAAVCMRRPSFVAQSPAGLRGRAAKPMLCAPAWRMRFIGTIGRSPAMLERRGEPAGRRPAPGRAAPVRIEPGFLPDAEGSVLIEMGATRVICTATVQEGVPPFLRGRGTRLGHGRVRHAAAQLARSASSGSAAGPGGRTHEIQRLIGRSLRAVTDLAALGERSILIDCDVLRADGGTRCASITGGFVALALALARLVRDRRARAAAAHRQRRGGERGHRGRAGGARPAVRGGPPRRPST